MPVVSIDVRPLIGIVHALATPGTSSAWSISRISASCEMWSAVTWRKSEAAHAGAHDEYQVGTRGQADAGFSVITVSSIESGAGSVGVSARPVLPSTRST